jgi:hypothetical protein
MPTHHLVLTSDEFDELKRLKMVPLDELPISDEEKVILKGLATKKLQPGPHPDKDQIPRVVCGMVDDAVVCMAVPR